MCLKIPSSCFSHLCKYLIFRHCLEVMRHCLFVYFYIFFYSSSSIIHLFYCLLWVSSLWVSHYMHACMHGSTEHVMFWKTCFLKKKNHIKSLFLEQVEWGQQRQRGRGLGRCFSSQLALRAMLGHVRIQRAGRFVYRKARLFSHAGCELSSHSSQHRSGHKQTAGQDSLSKHLINVTDVRSTPSPLNMNMYRQLFLKSATRDATPTPNQLSSEESCCNILHY